MSGLIITSLPLFYRNTLIPTVQETQGCVRSLQLVLFVEHDIRHLINVPIDIVQNPCPIFTPIVNLYFNTDDDDDSNYGEDGYRPNIREWLSFHI